MGLLDRWRRGPKPPRRNKRRTLTPARDHEPHGIIADHIGSAEDGNADAAGSREPGESTTPHEPWTSDEPIGDSESQSDG